jgi:uncharacterized protein YdaU (DUF1376 family)
MPSNRIPYFDFYPSDFMRGVRGLSAQEVGVYTMLLCRMYEENGPVEYHVFRLATYCGMRERTFLTVVEKLILLDKITLEGGMIYNARAEREITNRSDKLKNNIKAGKASAEKRQEKQGDGATPVQQVFNHKDTDTDIKKREAKASPKNATGTRLDRDWFLPMDWGRWAVDLGMSQDTIRAEADRFRDYWVSVPGAKGRKTDWQATWRNWCRKAMETKGKSNGRTSRAEFDVAHREYLARIASGQIKPRPDPSDPFAYGGGTA